MTQKIAGILFIVAGAVGFVVFLVGIFGGLERIEPPGRPTA